MSTFKEKVLVAASMILLSIFGYFVVDIHSNIKKMADTLVDVVIEMKADKAAASERNKRVDDTLEAHGKSIHELQKQQKQRDLDITEFYKKYELKERK